MLVIPTGGSAIEYALGGLGMSRRSLRAVALFIAPVATLALSSGIATAQDGERCYGLDIEAWQPTIQPAADSLFHRPPDWFGLTTQPSSDGSGYQVRSTVVIKGSIRQTGTWIQPRPDTLEVWWADMFTGVSIEFEVRGDSLVGIAHLLTDDVNASYAHATAGARAVLRPCPAPSENAVTQKAGA